MSKIDWYLTRLKNFKILGLIISRDWAWREEREFNNRKITFFQKKFGKYVFMLNDLFIFNPFNLILCHSIFLNYVVVLIYCIKPSSKAREGVLSIWDTTIEIKWWSKEVFTFLNGDFRFSQCLILKTDYLQWPWKKRNAMFLNWI